LHRFYGSNSEMLHGTKEEHIPAVGQVNIREKIKSLCFQDCHTKVAQLDAFITIGNGIVIQVAGEMSNNQQPLRRFVQTFVLGPQEREGVAIGNSFYVHNDVFRYQDDIFDESPECPKSEAKSGEKMQRNGRSRPMSMMRNVHLAAPFVPAKSRPAKSVPIDHKAASFEPRSKLVLDVAKCAVLPKDPVRTASPLESPVKWGFSETRTGFTIRHQVDTFSPSYTNKGTIS